MQPQTACPMKADCFSTRQYFPMLLANGNDAVLVDYSGSMVSSLANHAHHEQHQGCPCGWYKMSHAQDKPPYKQIQPIVQSGYFVIVHGEILDIDGYEQAFDPTSAILRTQVSLRGVALEIESFLTDEGVLVERYKVHKAPAPVRLALVVDTPVSWFGAVQLRETSQLNITRGRDQALKFNHCLDGVSGVGMLFTDKPPDGYGNYPYTAQGIYFDKVKPGWSAAKYLIPTDPTDGRGHHARLKAIVADYRQKGFSAVKKAHQAAWRKYFASSQVKLPDAALQYHYDLGRYVLRAHQHRDTGGITVGMLPHLWSGGTYVPYDAHFAHQALLQTNCLAESRRYIDYYFRQRPVGKRLARKHGLPGAVYSGWTNCFGQHRARNFEEYVFHYKPMMSGVIALEFYWQWAWDPLNPRNADNLAAMKEILDLAIECFIDEQTDRAVIRPCMAGDETSAEVQNDTFTAILFSRALAGLVEMAQGLDVALDPVYARLAEKLHAGWQDNYQDGILLTYPGCKYRASMQPSYYIFNLPAGTRPSSIYGYLKHARTRWGLDSSNPAEAYRDWPWCASRSSVALSHMGDSAKSFRWLRHAARYASSLGAIPEKIRIDGYAIGYWYSSPQALFVWSVAAALCHEGEDRALRLLWGLDGRWTDLQFADLRMAQGLLVSLTLAQGRVTQLKLQNTTDVPIFRRVRMNPQYQGLRDQDIIVPARKTLCLPGRK